MMVGVPESEDAWFAEGNRRMAAADPEGAEACFREALARDPEFAEALGNLGLLRERAGAYPEAEDCHRRAIALRPKAPQLYLNLGVLLMNLRRYREAETVFRQALVLGPNSAPAWSNLGVLLIRDKREAEAENCLRTAIALDCTYARASFNLSYLLLRQGRLEEGWQHLEVRDWYRAFAEHFDFPRWQGQSPAGKSFLIVPEAGHGDMIQFCRYASLLKDLGAGRVDIVCHPGLKTLFATLLGADQVYSYEEEVPQTGWDYWTPPLSLPYHCRTRLQNIPAPIPYLRADPAKVAHWETRFGGTKPRIGLSWKGNPKFENDGERSLASLEVLAPLGTVTGVRYFGLQKGLSEVDTKRIPDGLDLTMLGDELHDFSDTAALISQLDLVISVDTAVAHLAGALGKPCWVLLPDHLADWRWLTNREDSPWYPGTLRLFRQRPTGGWDPVVSDLVAALEAWSKARISA